MTPDDNVSKADSIMLSWFEAMGESPRGFVICCVAMIDDELSRLIRREMNKKIQPTNDMDEEDTLRPKVIESIFDPVKGGSLQSIHAKRQLAYAMSWIDDNMYHDIGLLAKIRNLFAHEREAPGFDDKRIHKLIRKLKYPLFVYDKKDLSDLSQKGRFMKMMHVDSEISFDTEGEPFAKTVLLTSIHMIVTNFQDWEVEEKDPGGGLW